jgi:hypothetical protein
MHLRHDPTAIRFFHAPVSPIAPIAAVAPVRPGVIVSLNSINTALGLTLADLTFAWTQTAGPTVTLAGADTFTPSFTTPAAPAATSVTFT